MTNHFKEMQDYIERQILKGFGVEKSVLDGTCTTAAPHQEPFTVEKLMKARNEILHYREPMNKFLSHTMQAMAPIALNIHVVHHDWPQVPNGVETVRFDAHPAIKWLARWLPIKPHVEAAYPRFRDADPYMLDGKLFMTPTQEAAFRRSLVVS